MLLDHATKDGRILTNKEYKNSGLEKKDSLKSFDAKLSGLVKGWVFAKVAFGKGGHQDNVLVRHMNLENRLKNKAQMMKYI